MKRKLPLFMAMLMMVSLLCAPVAHAAAASPDQGTVVIDDPDVPLVDIPEIRIPVGSDGVVSEDELIDAAAQVNGGEASRITIYPMPGATVDEVTLPQKGVKDAIDAGAELKVETSYGKAIFRASALSAYDGDIILVIKEEVDVFGNEMVLHVYVLCNGITYYNWTGEELTLYVPAVGGNFVVDNSYSVKQYNADGRQINTHVGQCVEEDDQLWVVITVSSNYLGYYVAQPDAVAGNAVVADPTVIASPLTVRTVSNDSTDVWASVQHWFDSVANHFMALLGL